MNEIEIQMNVNGADRTLRTQPSRTLLDILRNDLGITSVKEGCSEGDCGACVVVMDDLAVNSCLVLAGQADGCRVVTVEGLCGENGELHPLQREFIAHWAFQCGFCTSGMILSSYALLLQNDHPTADEIREAISGNLCRCTSYRGVLEAVQAAAAQTAAGRENG